jgi:hypothetical protein
VRDLQFVVTDGKSWVEREDTSHTLVRTDPRSLSYQQVNTDAAALPHRQDLHDGSRPLRAADARAFRVADE